MSDEIRVTIEREECIQCGICWGTCPEFFAENLDDGFSEVVEEYRVDDNLSEGLAPVDLEDCVTEAADSCPVAIIEVEA